jgi:hypothetical protein
MGGVANKYGFFIFFACHIHRFIRSFSVFVDFLSFSTKGRHDHYHCKHNELQYTFL